MLSDIQYCKNIEVSKMSTYMMMPKDYYRELQRTHQYDKANSFFNYCFNLDEKNEHSVRFYSNKWNVSIGTAHNWLKEFIEEVHKHHDFWVFQNEKNRPKTTERYVEQKLNAKLNAKTSNTSDFYSTSINYEMNKNCTSIEQRINTKIINKRDSGKKQVFSVPSIEEIAEYIATEKLNIDANKFYYYYESNGWMVGKNKMKSWKMALKSWNSQNSTNKTVTKKEVYGGLI